MLSKLDEGVHPPKICQSVPLKYSEGMENSQPIVLWNLEEYGTKKEHLPDLQPVGFRV